MQLGFVIDHGRCIGCHACTVACKAENDVPVGSFRTWVKYTERGNFPDVRRSFGVLRCNQCTDAPCVEICPVHALDKRDDGIVDIDPQRCIGCKSCMQGCPYDALYINDDHGVAEKCHFCAHRTERGLAPACAVVCPTEAIIPGDFHDPESVVSTMRREGTLTARKLEAGTGPNVWYREATEDVIDPSLPDASRPFLWSNRLPGIDMESREFDAMERRAESRTVYDVDHKPLWGRKVSAYMLTKSIAAGVVLTALPFLAVVGRVASILALLFLALTTVLLVADLKRPERFLYILRYPNWRSWLTRGAVVLMGFGMLTTVWGAGSFLGFEWSPVTLTILTIALALSAVLTAGYTAFLFGQARGRPLWMRRGLFVELIVHAVLAGASLWILLEAVGMYDTGGGRLLRWVAMAALGARLAALPLEHLQAPAKREAEYRRVLSLLLRGPLARRRWIGSVVVGTAIPLLCLLTSTPWLWGLAGLLALVGLWFEEDTFVQAGQALPIS
ncbi:MAG: polysulfide reductase NrfD [Acidobacteriota bacterium]|nr:polysulfide reductase NrfD [Acidobacteriota bacterium]MDH3785553.1 polysulfide reductase NrfD [Acidobacteriota bacterium]